MIANAGFYRLIKGYVQQHELEQVIQETFAWKQKHYTDANLASHVAYLSDTKPNRTSHAYAISSAIRELETTLPYINLRAETEFPLLTQLYRNARNEMGLSQDNRVLFNVQEYYGGSEAVPKHCDGELLKFEVDDDGSLNIQRSIRPDLVGVLTLINDTDGGGTRVHYPDDLTSQVVRAQAGDLLIFNNASCHHSVDPLKGEVKREDGLLRLTVGWRSLGDRCHYMESDRVTPISQRDAEKRTEMWYANEWPKQWEKISAKTQKAAF